MIDGTATTSDHLEVEEEEEDETSKDGTIDPADFLEAGSGDLEEEEEEGAQASVNDNIDEDNIVAEVEEEDDDDDDDEEGELVIGEEEEDEEEEENDEDVDARKSSDTFRTSTSKNKLESLLGKEFKHPRRKCSICGYTVSYSNFKRHLRNAHPSQYRSVPYKSTSPACTKVQLDQV